MAKKAAIRRSAREEVRSTSISRERLRKLRQIEIITNQLVNEQLAGQYHSVFKGRGMDFDEVRQYQPGDDVRLIDWNVSARMNDVYIKQFVEERELTVFLLVDASASHLFGSVTQSKREVAAELAALLAFSAIKNNDRVGLILFTDEVEKFLPPKKGRKHVLRVITEILNMEPQGKGTSIVSALDFLGKVGRRRSVAFLVSDFLDEGYETAANIASKRHDLIPVVLVDPLEERLPNMGLVLVEDPETGATFPIDTSSRSVRSHFRTAVQTRRINREHNFRRFKIDYINIATDQPYLEPVVNYFRIRAKRH